MAKNKKRKLSRSAILLIVGSIIILVPCLIFGGIILSAIMQTGEPIFGDRYNNDLDPAISDSSIASLESTISSMSNVDDCEITLISGQLRVNVDVSDSLTTEEVEALAEELYTTVDASLPIGTYFTSTEEKKMYDLAINVYNFIDADSDSMIYYIVTKNSKMEDHSTQLVSEPIDADLAAELRGETDPLPTDSTQNVIE